MSKRTNSNTHKHTHTLLQNNITAKLSKPDMRGHETFTAYHSYIY